MNIEKRGGGDWQKMMEPASLDMENQQQTVMGKKIS